MTGLGSHRDPHGSSPNHHNHDKGRHNQARDCSHEGRPRQGSKSKAKRRSRSRSPQHKKKHSEDGSRHRIHSSHHRRDRDRG
ncbi:unnamed protein product, partial [Chrysoparadoxa australica]